MTQLSYSGVIVRKNDVGYGVVSRARLIHVAIAAFPDRSYHCLSSIHAPDIESQNAGFFLEKIADGHMNSAIKLYHEFASSRFVPEMMAYLRTVPETFRSSSFDTEEVRKAISSALKHTDVFRAAVTFETCIPYLVADKGLLETMQSILNEAKRQYDPVPWLKEAASISESGLIGKSPYLATLINEYRSNDETSSQAIAI